MAITPFYTRLREKLTSTSFKLSLPIIISILSTIYITNATFIDVNVAETLEGQLKIFYTPNQSNIFRISTEFYNTGSVGYKARARLDVLNRTNNQTEILFTGWSKEKPLMPGDRETFEIYWYKPNTTGNFTARIRVYYANEISEDETEFSIEEPAEPKDIFEIYDFRTYDDYVRFDLKSNETANIIAFVSKYPKGWIFEQTKASVVKDGYRELIIPFKASIFTEKQITVSIASADGRYYKEGTFNLEREKGVWKYIHLFIDYLKRLFTGL